MSTRRIGMALCLLLVGFSIAGCTAGRASQPTDTAVPTWTMQPTYTPFPTLTPQPTYTPFPSATPTSAPTPTPTPTLTPEPTPFSIPSIGGVVEGARWQVKATSVDTATKLSDVQRTYSLKPGAKSRLVIVTLEYTNLVAGAATLYPATVLLVHTGTPSEGWVRTPSLMRDPRTGLITDLMQTLVRSTTFGNSPITEQFAWECPTEFVEFLLFFPETPPIAVEIK